MCSLIHNRAFDKEILLSFLLNHLSQIDNFVFLWNGKIDDDNYQSFLFTDPIQCIVCYEKSELISTLSYIEDILSQGYYLAGFISYEVGFCFEDIKPFTTSKDFPLLWFGVYRPPIMYNHNEKCFYGSDNLKHLLENYEYKHRETCTVEGVKANVKRDEYIQDVESIRSLIAQGETYQVNYTFKYKFDFDGSSEDLFFNLCMKQSASYAAFIRCLGMDILSLSPELFFRKNIRRIVVKPMKGTIKRGINNSHDIQKADELYNSEKNRAENVMIVDLLRNDIGRTSKIGSVKVNKLYEIEKYETLFQMTSTVESELKEKVSWLELFKSIFPCGSVTGAPKINTMRIIDKLEKEPRGIYTGSIGYIGPDNTSTFNVAIRTVVLDKTKNTGEMGIGSGIVYDSDASSEFDECLLKADFLTTGYTDFQLIETILWENNEFYLLDLHLKRLYESAQYFGFYFDRLKVIQSLKCETQKFLNPKKYRVRCLLYKNGDFIVSSRELDKVDTRMVTFSTLKTNSEDRFLYHKTTNRKIYDREFQKARAEGYYDLIFMNNQNEVTEGAISNIIIENKNRFYTPSISCGVLNGVFRQHLFETGFPLEERILTKYDILRANRIYMVNSVRGMVEVRLDDRHEEC